MTKAERSRLIKKIIAEAKASGELRYRIFLVKEQIKVLQLQSEDDADSLKTRQPAKSSREEEMWQALQDHRRYLVRMGYLQQVELDQLEKVSGEVEAELEEMTSYLLEGTIPG
ncbi:MAG TPA: hypothetical protein VNW25_04000 [Candidatus Sulfotelmatobacter sp.]|jgi:hypothetical protein|nr:hypothetical protein [Candidatus Sulfotelmatobacter sp.]